MKKDMPLEGLRWSRDSGSALCDTSQNSRSRTGWGGTFLKNLPPIKETFFKLLRKMRIPRYWIFLSMLFVLGKELETES